MKKTPLVLAFFLVLAYVYITGSGNSGRPIVFESQESKRKHKPKGHGIPKFIDFKTQEDLQMKRKQFLHNQCRKNKAESVDIQTTIGSNIMVNDKYKLLFCFIPKVGCTTWKRILLVLNGYINSTLDLNPGQVKQAFPNVTKLNEVPAEEALEKLNTYTKVAFFRHPFSRVLSAYRSKLRPGLKFDYTKQWRDKLGEYIMKNYRPKVNEGKNYDLTFTEFVQYLGDETQKNHRYYYNDHFRSQYKICRPCEMDYDYIGTMETFVDDAEYMLNKLVNDRFVELPLVSGTNSSSLQLQLDYYSKVPMKYLKFLYERYRQDFLMLGYSPNAFLHYQ